MSEELSKEQKDRGHLRGLLTRFLKIVDDMEEQERMDKELGKEHNGRADAILTLMSLTMLQTGLQAFGRIYVAEHQAMFETRPGEKVQ